MGKGGGCGASKVARAPSVSAQPVVQEDDDEAFWHLYVSWTTDDEQGTDGPASTSATAPSRCAVRLSYLLEFLATKLPLGDPNMPSWSIALNIVQPATADMGLPYAALPEVAPHVLPAGSTTPYYFVSHAWSRPLREAADLLVHHFRGRDPRDVYVWLDLFAVRQQSFGIAPRGPDVAELDAAIKNSGGVLLCLDEAGLALRRTWCLYESWMGATAPAAWATSTAATPPAAAAAAARPGTSDQAVGRPASAAAGAGAGAGGGSAGRASPPPVGVTALTPRAMLPEERARLFSKIDVRQSRCKYKVDRDALLAAARAATGPGGLDAVNNTLRLALMLRPNLPDLYRELHPGRIIEVPELWDMSRIDSWFALPESNKHFSAMALYGPACSGKSVAAAAVAAHLRSRGVPVAAHFCNVSDVRTLDPVTVVTSLALQLAQAPGIGPRLLRQYGELPAGLLADLVSYNNTPLALEAAVEALLVQPLQRLLMPDTDEDPAAAAAAAAANGGGGGGREWHDNGDLGALGGGCDEDLEGLEGAEGGGGGRGQGLQGAGARSIRPTAAKSGPPKVVVLLIDGVDQADGAIMGGAAPFDNQVLQLIEEHLPKLPSFVRLVLTSRSLSYIVPRLADRLSPLELSPDVLRPPGPFLRNVRLAIAAIDPSMGHRHRAAIASNLVSKSRGSLLYIKMALSCLELERDVAAAEAEADRVMAAATAGTTTSGRFGGGRPQAADVRRPLSRLASSKKPAVQFPSSLGALLERYLAVRLRLLNSTELRNKAATVLAVLAAAREPLTAMQVAATIGGTAGGWGAAGVVGGSGGDGGATRPPPPLLAPPPTASERLLSEFVAGGLGALVRIRGGPTGHVGQQVLLVHSAVSEWLQHPKPRVLLGGSVVVDLAAGHRALASLCRDDALGCLHRGRLQPYSYSVRHIFLHVGLAAMAASAAEASANADAASSSAAPPLSPSSVATGRSSAATVLRSRSGTTSYNSSAAVALAAALAAAAASADWIATLELLLQRLDLWTSIYTAGAGGAARWVVQALASLPMCSIPSADPGSTDSPLLMLLAETRRWLLMYHSQLCWFPLAVVASAATLPEDSALRSRALEFSAGPDPWEVQPLTKITVMPASSRATLQQQQQQQQPPPSPPPPLPQAAAAAPPSSSPAAAGALPGGGGGGGTASLDDPREEEHLLLLSTGDMWSGCMQTLRTGPGRVVRVAMQPAGRLVATVHDDHRGIVLWDIWGARPLLTPARSGELGSNPTAAFFTPDGRKLICASRSIFIWEVATGRLLLELCKAAPKKGGSGALGGLLPGGGGGGAAAGGGSAAAAAAAAGSAAAPDGGGDPDGPVTALALSPGGGRVAAGHGNGVTRVWEVASGKLLATTSVPHRRPVTSLAFSLPKGATLVAAHGEGGDAAPRAVAPIGAEELGDVPTALIKADELLLHVWRIQGNAPKELEVLKGHTGRVNTLEFSTYDRNMVTGSADETIRTWWDDPKTPQSDYRQVFILGGAGQGVVHTMRFSPPAPPSSSAAAAAAQPPGHLLPAPSRPPTALTKSFAGGSALAAADGAAADTAAAADGGTCEAPVVDFTAPSAACLSMAAFGSNAAPSRETGGVATPDVPGSGAVSARGSAAGTFPDANGGGAGGGGGSGGGGGNGRGPGALSDADAAAAADEDVRGDVPVMAYSCGNGIIRLWSPAKRRQVGLLRGLEGRVGSLSFSGDGRLLASADESGAGLVRIWDVGGASVTRPLDCSPSSGAGGLPLRHPVDLMVLSPDGSRVAIVCADLTSENLRVIDVFTGRRLAVMGPRGAGGHDKKINYVAWSWDSSRVATCSDDLTVRVWYVGKPTAPPGDALAAAAAIVAAELAAREAAAAAGDTSGAAAKSPWGGHLLDDDTSASRHLIRLPVASGAGEGGIGAAAAAAAAATAGGGAGGAAGGGAAAGFEGSVATRPGQCQLVLTGHHRKVQCVAWAHSGKKLASGGYDQMIRIWDTATGEQLTLIYQVTWVSALAWSPDDARLASGAGGRAVYMFNSTTGKNLAAYSGPLPGDSEEEVAAAARVEAAAAAAALQSAKAPEGAEALGGGGGSGGAADSNSWIAALRFNPEGTLLACRDMHCRITLWDVSGMRLKPLRALDGAFREAIFCPTSGDLQLYDLTAVGALVVHAIPARSLPLGRAVQRAVTLSHPLLEFRGVAVDTAVNHNAAVLLTSDNRAFFFVNGAHLAAVRQEAVRAERGGTASTVSEGGTAAAAARPGPGGR